MFRRPVKSALYIDFNNIAAQFVGGGFGDAFAGWLAWLEDGQFDPAERERIVGTTPLARIGAAEDIAQAVHFLACASYVTGQIIAVDGGYSTTSVWPFEA